jgi:hypothetical protein
MAKFELVKRTEINGEVWYNIRKNGLHVQDSTTRDFEMACEMLESFKKGKQSEPIFEIIKSIEIDEELLKKIYED